MRVAVVGAGLGGLCLAHPGVFSTSVDRERAAPRG
jgi:hypothetical protein